MKRPVVELTGVCAFSASEPETASSNVEKMLRAMQMRGTLSESSEPRRTVSGWYVVGFCHEKDSLNGQFQNTMTSLQAVDGCFFLDQEGMGSAIPILDGPDSFFASPGGFSLLGMTDGHLIAARDQLGLKPLYWGGAENKGYGFASTITSLKRVGVPEPKPVGSGEIVELQAPDPRISKNHVLTKPKRVEIREDDAVDRLSALFLKAVSLVVPKRSGLAFSGGVDSALVATACKKIGLETQLITVAMTGQPELEHAKRAAEDIGLPLTTKSLMKEEVLEAAPGVSDLVETKSPVTLGISLPFHFVCGLAHELGLRSIVMGQLSDELFGGYARFEETALKEGLDQADEAMWKSVVAAAEGDFAPGDKVASSFGIELRCPFAYLPLAEFALQLPVALRVNVSNGGVVRKYLLRRLAEKWGLPSYIVDRPKKAFQYSSGVQKVLVKASKRQTLIS